MQADKAILAGTLYTPTERIKNAIVLIKGARIAKVGPKREIKIPTGTMVYDHRNATVGPGFLDLHIHGGGGRDLMEGTPEAVSVVAKHLARHGTTSFLPTTVTSSFKRTLEAARGLGEIIRAGESSAKDGGAQPLGIHFEGPFINVVRRGVHPAAHIRKPTVEALEELLKAAGGAARVLTLAPEMDDGLAVLRLAVRRGVRVGIGHSDATYDEAEQAIDAGASHAIHVFNAMRPFQHRDPGIIGAVLTDDRVSAELISDGVHVDPAAVRLLVRSKGLSRVLLVTDSLSCAGMPDGTYPLGEFTVRIADGACRAPEGTLAGSILTLDKALINFSRFIGVSYEQCLPCATINPAKVIGLERRKGRIAPGADADLVVLNKQHAVIQSYVRGRPVREKSAD